VVEAVERDARDPREAAEEYRRNFARSEDPLAGLVRRFGDGAAGVGDWVGSGAGRMRDWWAGGRRPNSDDDESRPPSDGS